MLSNKEVSSIFKTLGSLMELHGENDFKARSYTNAAFQLGRLHDNVMAMSPAQLETTPGIGKSIAGKITELKTTGTLQTLENLLQLTPPGIVEIMSIKGLGAKKVAVIWKELGVESAGELLYACYENRLAKLKGFGEKTQDSVIKSIEYYQSNLGKFHYASVEQEADEIVTVLRKEFATALIDVCGPVRRKSNIIDRIDILAGMEKNVFMEKMNRFSFLSIDANDAVSVSGKTANEIPFRISFCDADAFYYALFMATGSEEHIAKAEGKLSGKKFASEQSVYEAASLPYIIPEMRENGDEWKFIAKYKNEDIVSENDIRGVVHSHSTWSDGKNTLEEMVIACIEKKFEYIVISDHSKTAVYAGGLTVEQIGEQQREIDRLNQKYVPFVIFKSIECDILNDGSMDYDNDVLKTFDLVIASVHQNLKMDVDKATSRLLKAIENTYTTILGHMTGRLLLSRPGYPVDHKKIIDACAANHVVIEINANPYRLDIDHTWIPYAMEKGVMISVNPDAHSIGGIHDIHWGVTSARKGGLTKQMTWNAMHTEDIKKWLSERKKKRNG